MQFKTASQLVFCRHFCTSHCILPANSKKYNFVRSCLVLFAKYNSSHEQVHEKLVRTQFRITSYFLFIHCTPQNSSPLKNNKNTQKFSVFGQNNSLRPSNFLQTHISQNSDHSSRTHYQISYRKIRLKKATIIPIMTTQAPSFCAYIYIYIYIYKPNVSSIHYRQTNQK